MKKDMDLLITSPRTAETITSILNLSGVKGEEDALFVSGFS